MVNSSWEQVELPILEAVVDNHQKAQAVKNLGILTECTGLDRDRVARAVRALIQAGYLQGEDVTGFGGDVEFIEIEPRPPALRATGAWPSA